MIPIERLWSHPSCAPPPHPGTKRARRRSGSHMRRLHMKSQSTGHCQLRVSYISATCMLPHHYMNPGFFRILMIRGPSLSSLHAVDLCCPSCCGPTGSYVSVSVSYMNPGFFRFLMIRGPSSSSLLSTSAPRPAATPPMPPPTPAAPPDASVWRA